MRFLMRLMRIVCAFVCVRVIRDAGTCVRAYTRGTPYPVPRGSLHARHARHNGANLLNLTNNKLISWLTRRDGFARHCSAFHTCTLRWIWVPMDFSSGSMTLFCTDSWKYPFDGTRSCLDRTHTLISGQNVIIDNEREFVSLSCDTFEVWILLF